MYLLGVSLTNEGNRMRHELMDERTTEVSNRKKRLATQGINTICAMNVWPMEKKQVSAQMAPTIEERSIDVR